MGSIIEARLTRKKYPLFVSWALTNRCNANCRYCGASNIYTKELTTREVLLIIKELRRLGARMISFIGGEPLLRDDIGEILRCCNRNDIFTTIFSNGILVADKIRDICLADKLRLSLDGNEEINDFLRGEGGYAKVMNAVKVALSYKISVTLVCTLTKYNLNCIDFLLHKAEFLGLSVRFKPLDYIHPINKDISGLLPEVGAYRKSIRKLMIKKIQLKNIDNSFSSLRYFYDWPCLKTLRHCSAGRIFCRISSRGDIFPCQVSEDRNNFKSLNCVTDGIGAAFYNLSRFNPLIENCKCSCAGTLDLNMLYNLKFGVF